MDSGVSLSFELLRLYATVYVSPQGAASVRAPRPISTASADFYLTAGLFHPAQPASLSKAAQSSFLGQTQKIFKRIDSGQYPTPLAVAEVEAIEHFVVAIKQTVAEQVDQSDFQSGLDIVQVANRRCKLACQVGQVSSIELALFAVVVVKTGLNAFR